MLERIVTHPGSAHKDDFLACALLAARDAVPIERRDPTEEDLADPATAVVDVGGEWDPARANFDHHQFPRDSEPKCALSLVLEHLGLYDDARTFFDWLDTAEYFDTRGPVGTARWLGVPREALGKLNSPLDVGLLRRFSDGGAHSPGEPLYEVMRMLGGDLIGSLENMRERLDFIDAHAELWELPVAEGLRAIFLPRTEPLPPEPAAGIGHYVELRGLADRVVAQVYPDRRGDGYGLSRINDDKRLEFTRIGGEPDVHFAHARGFVAKTSATEPARLKELLAAAFHA